MNKRYYEIREYIESFDYILLSDEYKNNKTKLSIQCPIGHIFEKSFNAFQNGQRCSICANINKSKKMKNNYNDIKEYIESFDGHKLLSKEYISNTDKLSIQCPIGHIFEKSFNAFQSGQRCTVCYELNRGKSRIYSYDYVKEYIESIDGYKLLSEEYERASKKLSIQCPIGHIYNVKFNSFQQGCRCPICANINKKNQPHKNNYDYIKECIESITGYKLLSNEYINTNSKLLIKCPAGHEFEKSFKLFKAGARCPICWYNSTSSKPEREIQDFISEIYNGKIINNDRNTIVNPQTGYNLELDVYLPEINKAIEFNGTYWHSLPYKIKNDNIKQEQCRNNNIQLLIIQEENWTDNKEMCLQVIEKFLDKWKILWYNCYVKIKIRRKIW